MGYIARQAWLIEEIANNKTLTPEQKFDAYETIVCIERCLGVLNESECSSDMCDDCYNSSLEEMHSFAASLNRILDGTGIEWDGSEVGEPEWLAKHQEFLSREGFLKIASNRTGNLFVMAPQGQEAA